MRYQNFGLGLENLRGTEINYCILSQGGPDKNWWGEHT